MRLHKLTIENFGSFKHRAVIDFAQLGNDLFLFHGDTGAGKTTILDAASFALFGSCSGTDRSGMDITSVHSDFAKCYDSKTDKLIKEPTTVDLVFAHDGIEYRVTRRLSWGKKGTNKDVLYESLLEGNDVQLSSEKKEKNDITRKIEEILGLNATQFAQVAILAQGEFEKFMKASPKEREQILTKLVDNDAYEDFQYRLKQGKKSLQSCMEAADAALQPYLEQLRESEGVVAEAKQQYVSLNPDLLQCLRDAVPEQERVLAEAERNKSALEREKSGLEQKKAVLDEQNKLFRELDKRLATKREEQRMLQEQAASFEKLAAQTAAAENALKVFPHYQALARAAAAHLKNIQKLSEYEQRTTELAEEERGLLSKKTEAEAQQPEIAARRTRAARLDEIIPLYGQLSAASEYVNSNNEALQGVLAAIAETQKQLSQKNIAIDECEKRLKSLAAFGSAAVTLAEKKLTELEARGKSLKQLQDAVEKLRELRTDIDSSRVSLKVLKAKYEGSWANYDMKNRERIAGQAAHLAREMQEALGAMYKQAPDEEHFVGCPVCGHQCTAADIDNFASAAGIISEQDVEMAKTAYEAAAKEYQALDRTVSSKISELNTLRTGTAEEFSKLLPSSSVEDVCGNEAQNSPLLSAIEDVRTEYRAAVNELKRATQAAEDKEKQEVALAGYKKELAALQAALEEKRKEERSCSDKLAESRAALENVQFSLKEYPTTEQEALREQAQCLQRAQALELGIKEAESAYNNCLHEISGNKSARELAEKQNTELETEENAARKSYEQGLQQYGFATEEVFREKISSIGFFNQGNVDYKALGEWLQAKQEELEKYNSDSIECAAAAKQCEQELAGKSLQDVYSLESGIELLAAELKHAEEKRALYKHTYELYMKALQKTEAIFLEKSEYQKLLEVLGPMADAANGTLSFNRYVLNDLFCQILESANRRLDKLCSGQFELQPVQEETDKRILKGLDFVVRDVINGTERDPGRLSGGEKFETALSLALGLSDVMQMQGAKNVKIESLFIDEGFGTLSEDNLQKTKEILLELAGTDRQIGIISHNDVLASGINKKIIVSRNRFDREGSRIRLQLD